MRYEGTDNAIMIQRDENVSFDQAFEALYQREFSFVLQGRDILIDDYRVRAVVPGETLETPTTPPPPLGIPEASLGKTRAFFENGWEDVAVYKSEDLKPGHEIHGPSIIVQPISTVVLEVGCKAFVTANGDFKIEIGKDNDGQDHTEDGADKEVVEDLVQLYPFFRTGSWALQNKWDGRYNVRLGSCPAGVASRSRR